MPLVCETRIPLELFRLPSKNLGRKTCYIIIICLNRSPDNEIYGLSKLKSFAGDKAYVVKKRYSIF